MISSLVGSILAQTPEIAAQMNGGGIDDGAFGLLGGLAATGLIVIGAGFGIGRLGGQATEAIARQPEAGGRIFTTMIIAASMIEGVALFGMVICFIAVWKSLGN